MPNRLTGSQSPYLLQHKDNPVDWYEWGEEAFAKAREEDKPIFLSIGYSTCHWCHVMAHESFEDEEVARLMNEAFVNIKLDREERPDIDQIYMTVCQMMTGQGGWPLTIVMTPEKEPFFAATYLPRDTRHGRIGMTDLVPRIQQAWEQERDRVAQTAATLTNRLRSASEHTPAEREPDLDDIEAAAQQLMRSYDKTHGGFGSAPKFPSPHRMSLLLRYAHRTDDDEAVRQVTSTLGAMRRGGLFDQVGFGFHRYSTDVEWKLPHFEKMLYDQATLMLAFTEAYLASGEAWLASTVEDVFTYLQRDLRSPQGAYFSAEDADSEGREGAFYVWTAEELRSALPEESQDFLFDLFNIKEEGNFLDEATRQRTGENVLHQNESLSEVADRHGLSESEGQQVWKDVRERLLELREGRERPGLDDKILTDWNGLVIAALAKAGAAMDNEAYLRAAEDSVAFIRKEMTLPDGRLLHRYRNGKAGITGKLDDYAFYIWGLLNLYEATFEPALLATALQLTEIVREDFASAEGGFFMATDESDLLARPKEAYDGAIPSGNSVMFQNLMRLARMTGETELEEEAARIGRFFGEHISKQPTGFTAMLCGVDLAVGPTKEVVLAGDRETYELQEMAGLVRRAFHPRTVLLHAPSDGSMDALSPFTANYEPVDGKATAYVCQNFSCDQPTTVREVLAEQLERTSS